jgi:membrane protein required for colicin V production
MLWVDTAILLLIGLYSLGGLMRGFNQEVFAIMFWLIGIVVAWLFSQHFAIFLLKIFSSPTLRLAGAFVALIVITLVIGWIIKLLLGKTVRKIGLGIIDRLGGMALGTIHGLIVVLVMIVIAGLTPLPKDRWWSESKYIPPFQSAAVMMKKNSSSKLASSINYHYKLDIAG